MTAGPLAPSRVSTVVAAPPEEAFRLLEDPTAFERLVAGARKVRRFDSRWPDPGTRLHHTLGIPPLVVRDHTEVVANRPGESLVLEAKAGPLGQFRVEFSFEADDGGCRLTVSEQPCAGPAAWPGVRRLTRMALGVRNREICRRYRKLARSPHGGPWGSPGA